MATRSKLRPEQEALLLTALEKTAEHIAAGSTPNSALAKSASALDVPEGHLPLLVYAYNTARTQEQLQSSNDPLEKSADFQLANLDAIRSELYPDAMPTPAQIKKATDISVEYAFPPTWYKAAAATPAIPHDLSVTDTVTPKPAPVATAPAFADTPEEQAKRRLQKRARDEQAVAEARYAKMAAELAARQELAELDTYFHKIGSESFTRVRDNVDALYGPDMMALLNYLEAQSPEFAKQAMTPFKPVLSDQEPYNLLETAVQRLKVAAERTHEFQEKTAAFAAAYPSVLNTVESRPSFFDGPAEKHAGSWGPMVGTALGVTATREAIQQMADSLKGPDPEAAVRKQMDRISAPDHELKLRNIQVRTTLQELMATDPVIKAHDPQTVVNVFNEVSQLAPRISSQPSILRSVLRKQLEQQHMEPFELGELAKIEQSLARPTPVLQIGNA